MLRLGSLDRHLFFRGLVVNWKFVIAFFFEGGRVVCGTSGKIVNGIKSIREKNQSRILVLNLRFGNC